MTNDLPASHSRLGTFFVVAVLAAASMWFYFDRILVAYQVADAAQQERPRGNLSDLYPRWLGARELLLHHVNPYSDEITLEIQKGYYGRVLDNNRPNDPKDRQGFAYPLYLVFVLAPLINFPFHNVQIFFHWMLVSLTAASVCLWLRALQWRLPCLAVAGCIALTLGSVPAVQGIKLQQISLLVAGLMAGAVACVAGGYLFCGGILLALATIKPQLAWPLVAWLLLWAVSDLRRRRKLVVGFGLTMALLLGGAEIILPGWWRMFAETVGQYHRYTQNQSVLEQLIPWPYAGKIVAGIAILGCGLCLWRLRANPAEGPQFGRAIALAMALTVLVVPMYAPYNQVLLVPAILVLVRDREFFISRSRAARFIYLAGAFSIAWQWLASIVLFGAYWLASPAWSLQGWKWPFFATFTIPVIAFALTYLDASRTDQRQMVEGAQTAKTT
ncbi:MAG: hypothetical protein JWQ87_4704 [Candidatus Sulfotelmatobacter sp.]|nr:hypothetical protein [Candidatus Sulfotelmatobacter sp.]